MRFLPAPFPQLFGRLNLFITTGFLPERFREEMQLTWSPRQQRQWTRLMGMIARVVTALPGPLRRIPYNACLLDMRLRIRFGRPLV